MRLRNAVELSTPAALLPHSNVKLRRAIVSLASDVLPLCDFVCLLLAGYISTLLYSIAFATAPLSPTIWIDRGNVALIGAVLAPFILYDQHFAAAASRQQTWTLIRSYVMRFILIVVIVFAIGVSSQVLDNLPQKWVAIWLANSLLLTTFTRVLLARNVRSLKHKGLLTESIAIVGAGPIADRLNHHLRQTRADNVELLGIFDESGAGASDGSIWPVKTLDELIELGNARSIDWILVALPDTDETRLHALVQRLKVLSVPIALCPQNVGQRLPCNMIDYVGNGLPVLLLADRPIKRWDAVVKATEDVVLGSVLTILLLPVFALIALAIKLDSPGPVIFRQRRHAFNNSEFSIYKFRTMQWRPAGAADTLRQTSRNDDRVTRVGRFLRSSSLDELPQLFNVLTGEMSLVGPRPHAINMRTEDRLGSEITSSYAHRHRVKPGMTGWSQVNGARGPTHTTAQLQRRIELDLYYIDNWSLALDLKILFMTCREVVKRTNAY
ncbi:MAG: undecaprenyl-phosphate glucose phosphotransferase [Candidatus Obscuribacterales bacterium]|nr:undecaprenyl-phosphate glucose phosphotransferase [Steroidobacteraceae bacterium]